MTANFAQALQIANEILEGRDNGLVFLEACVKGNAAAAEGADAEGADAEGADAAPVEHTWSEEGPLGLRMEPIGETQDAPGGVKIKSESKWTELVGLTIQTIAGEDICLFVCLFFYNLSLYSLFFVVQF